MNWKNLHPTPAAQSGSIFESTSKRLLDCQDIYQCNPGGMVITSRNLSALVPLEPARMPGRRVCQWDKDMVEDAGLIKVDLLGLGMLAVVRETVDLIADAHGVDIDLDAIPPGDSKVYNMLAVADVLGVFQVESRVQMSTCRASSRDRSRNWQSK